jgi:hypothetical protein
VVELVAHRGALARERIDQNVASLSGRMRTRRSRTRASPAVDAREPSGRTASNVCGARFESRVEVGANAAEPRGDVGTSALRERARR